MLTFEITRRIDVRRNVLVGKLHLPIDHVEHIKLTLIYKFIGDLDEKSIALGWDGPFFNGDLAKYDWRALMPQKISADERMNLCAEGIETPGGNCANGKDPAKHLPQLYRDVLRKGFLKFCDDRTFAMFLGEIDAFAYSHSEELSYAFEYLLQCLREIRGALTGRIRRERREQRLEESHE